MAKTKTADCHTTSSPISDKNVYPVIGLIGMPNSGKTTLFNDLTGSNFKTSNYPGATVEYSAGRLLSKYGFNATALDSPGIISLNPSSPDEQITINGLFSHPKYGQPDVVIVTCDCTQLSRQLFLVKQVVDAGFKTVVAVTMNDLLAKKELSVSAEKLSVILGCPVVKINAAKKEGLAELIKSAEQLYLSAEKIHLHKPEHPGENEIAELYEFTGKTETEVITSINKSINIAEINRKVFNELHRRPHETTLKLDKFFLHPFWGIIIFIVLMGALFTSIFWIAAPLMDLVDTGFGMLSDFAAGSLPEGTWYTDLIINGVIAGFGSVMVFVPQIVILFILLGLLEDTGYLARAAMLIDKPLSKFGLNGRSFIPMLSGYACAIPAMMAARTISNRRERYLTIMIIPLMSCSARIPVYALLLAFVVPPDKPWIGGLALGALYLFSLIAGAVVAGVISKFKKTDERSTFMLELPPYRTPVLRHVLKHTYYKAASYVKQAGPTIVVISLILWMLTYFPNTSPNPDELNTEGLSEEQIGKLVESERLNTSYAAVVGKSVLEPILTPLGWDWRVGVSLIAAFAAREVFVSSMAITFSITEDDEDEEQMQSTILQSMREAKSPDGTRPLFTTASTIALIIYFMFAMQCLTTVAVARKETGGWKIPIMQVVVYTVMAYVLALVTYQGLNLIGIQ